MHLEAKSADIEVEIKKLRHAARAEFENLFGRYAFDMGSGYQGMDIPGGTIKNLALRHGIKTITVNGKRLKLDQRNIAASLDNIDEDVLDALEEEGFDLYNTLVRKVVNTSLWLGRDEPFSMVFGSYVDSEKENPTKDTSGNGSTSASVIPAI